ncbi:MAG: hypothetical protein KJ858_04870 [Nanoarchaeota archaeon]|nr:hypothetical protein [Nanoarchaeota archaeon]
MSARIFEMSTNEDGHFDESTLEDGFGLLAEGNDSYDPPEEHKSPEERALHELKQAPYEKHARDTHKQCRSAERMRDIPPPEPPRSYGLQQPLVVNAVVGVARGESIPVVGESTEGYEDLQAAQFKIEVPPYHSRRGAKSTLTHHSTKRKALVREAKLDSPRH